MVVSLTLAMTMINCGSGEKEQKLDGWVSLFNGKDLTDWTIKFTGHELNDNYKNTFRVDNGVLKISYDELSRDPTQVLARILRELGLDEAIARGISPPVAKLADATNRIWAERYLAQIGNPQ